MKKHLKRPLAGCIAILGLLAVAVMSAWTSNAAAAAIAPGDVQTIYHNFYGYPTATNPAVTVDGVVSCPAGNRVVGMGAGNGTVAALSPVQNFTAVRMIGGVSWPSPTTGGNFIQVEVLCAPASQFADVKTVVVHDHRARTQHGPGGAYLRTVASCPAGYYAFGGGGYFSKNSDESGFEIAYWITGNGPTPDGNGWAFTAQAWIDSQTMVVQAQCAPRTGRELIAQGATTVVANPHPGSNYYTGRSAYAHCPSGYIPISGGWYLATPSGTQAFPLTAQNYIGHSIWSVGGPQTNHDGLFSWYANVTAKDGNKLITLAQCIRP